MDSKGFISKHKVKGDFKLISVSGGRSSMMLAKILSDNGVIDKNTLIAFANTGLEHEETLIFIDRCSKEFNLNIVWLEYRKVYPFFEVVSFETASRDGRPFRERIERNGLRYLPNIVKRFCTGDLKIKTISRYIRSIRVKGHYDTYLGLRYDEPSRVAKKKLANDLGKEAQYYRLPLHDMRITKKERNDFWASQSFDLGIEDRFSNCVGCFMKGETNLIRIFRDNPNFGLFFKEMESKVINAKRKRNAQFNKVWSYKDLLHVAKSQLEILDFEYQGISCGCHD